MYVYGQLVDGISKSLEDIDVSEYLEYLQVGSHPEDSIDYYPPCEEDTSYDED